jgi:putative transposase
MSEYIHKSHNVSVIMYHFVCPTKYRRVVFSEAVDMGIKEICQEIEKRYDMQFLEIGTEKITFIFSCKQYPS